ncbi:MAG: hypothetical protein ABGY41_14445, partial [Candidatus Poribacteria bacterium]
EGADAADRTHALSALVGTLAAGGAPHIVTEPLARLRTIFELLPPDADPYVRASGLAGIVAGLSAQNPCDCAALATAARALLPLATAHDYADMSGFARTMLSYALGLQESYTPESREEEAAVHQALAVEDGSANSSVGVVMHLDAVGQHAVADLAAATLEGTDLAENISDPSLASVIRARGAAYLALRANDPGAALQLRDEHAEGPGSVRVRLFRCVAWYAQGDIERAQNEWSRLTPRGTTSRGYA